MADWQRVEPAVWPAGDVGGDLQMSEAFGARWQVELGGGLWAVVDRNFYVVDPQAPFLEVMTDFAVWTDPDRPGDTEQGGQTLYGEVADCPATDQGVRDAALHAQPPTEEEWSANQPPWLDEYLADVQVIVDGFEYELCGECGRDLDAHVIAPDPLGKPHAWCQEG